jgi:hypothetical protein
MEPRTYRPTRQQKLRTGLLAVFASILGLTAFLLLPSEWRFCCLVVPLGALLILLDCESRSLHLVKDEFQYQELTLRRTLRFQHIANWQIYQSHSPKRARLEIRTTSGGVHQVSRLGRFGVTNPEAFAKTFSAFLLASRRQ